MSIRLNQKIIAGAVDTSSNKANVDLDNLSEVGEKHFLNKSEITNCLLEIPQNIKLELVDGTLILKAGSKVIVPNGFEADGTTPKFDEVVIKNDISQTVTSAWAMGKHIICYNKTHNAFLCRINHASGTSPSGGYTVYYNTSANIVRDTYITDCEYSLPIGFATVENVAFTSIDQVFNGMGYIGSTIWADKGIKGLIPNGRNEDGTLNNIEVVTTKVTTHTNTANDIRVNSFIINSAGYVAQRTYLGEFASAPTPSGYWGLYYNTTEQIFYYNSGGTWVKHYGCIVGIISSSSTGITLFEPNQPFRAVDYNEYKTDISNKVSKSGDTIIGNLIAISNPFPFIAQSSIMDITNTPTSSQHIGYDIRDKNGTRLSWLGVVNHSNGQKYFQIQKINGITGFEFPRCTTKATTTSTASNINVAVIVQNYKNGTSWYRVWSDGWIEQGGISGATANVVKVSLLKSFSDTNYLVIGSRAGANATLNIPHSIASKLVNSFEYYVQETGGNIYWYACGY